MIIKEYRIPLPFTVEEYQIGQLYSVCEQSKTTGLCDSMEILANEPYNNVPLFGGQYTEGQYTHKVYYVDQKVPSYLRKLFKGTLDLHEESWNAYPYIRTMMTNPPRKDSVFVIIESIHLPDRGHQENVHGLPPDKLEQREVVFIDIGVEALSTKDSKDPQTFKSEKTGRGPFTKGWQMRVNPIMTCYKLVTIEIKLWAFQSRIENYVANYQKKIFSNFHQELVCCMDEWLGLNMADIRVCEERTKRELDEKKATACKRPGSGKRKRSKSFTKRP